MTKIKQIKIIQDESDVNHYLSKGWTILAIAERRGCFVFCVGSTKPREDIA
jgi:hypothetical protein